MNELAMEKAQTLAPVNWHLSRIRLFGLYIHSQFLLLLILEIFITCLVVYIGGTYLDLILKSFEFSSAIYFKIISVPLVLSISMAGVGLYSSRQPKELSGILLRFGVAVLLAVAIFTVLYSLTPALVVSVQRFLLLMSASLIGLAVIRFCFYRLLQQKAKLEKRVLVIGTGDRANSVAQWHKTNAQPGFDLVGFLGPVDLPNTKVDKELITAEHNALSQTVVEHRINEIVIALDDRRQKLPSDDLLDCKMSGVGVVDLLDFLERESGQIHFDHLNPSWLIYANGFNSYVFTDFLKRSFDIACSLILLTLTAPVFLLAALAIWIEAKGKDPIFYSQKRVGLMGENFSILKFRSMRTDAEKDGQPVWAEEKDPRVTRTGGIIRKYRIDELPQLINVLLGQMSLVGPRPERPEIVQTLNKLNSYYHHRHRVKPGLTGWAQLRFKYGSTEENAIEKLQYDLYYLKNSSILFDLYILIQTVEVVLFRKGAR